MNLEEGILNEGLPFNIPDSPRHLFPMFMKARGYKVGAEIGVSKGEFTEEFCKVGLKMFAVDSWEVVNGQGRLQMDRHEHECNFQLTCNRLSNYDCEIVRKSSMDAVKDFSDNSLDFVYIDANHTLPFVVNDIWWWSKKVRIGGIISGHDYFCTPPHATKMVHVLPAVEAVVKVLGLKNYWTFGGRGKINRSWMWIK